MGCCRCLAWAFSIGLLGGVPSLWACIFSDLRFISSWPTTCIGMMSPYRGSVRWIIISSSLYLPQQFASRSNSITFTLCSFSLKKWDCQKLGMWAEFPFAYHGLCKKRRMRCANFRFVSTVSTLVRQSTPVLLIAYCVNLHLALRTCVTTSLFRILEIIHPIFIFLLLRSCCGLFSETLKLCTSDWSCFDVSSKSALPARQSRLFIWRVCMGSKLEKTGCPGLPHRSCTSCQPSTQVQQV